MIDDLVNDIANSDLLKDFKTLEEAKTGIAIFGVAMRLMARDMVDDPKKATELCKAYTLKASAIVAKNRGLK